MNKDKGPFMLFLPEHKHRKIEYDYMSIIKQGNVNFQLHKAVILWQQTPLPQPTTC